MRDPLAALTHRSATAVAHIAGIVDDATEPIDHAALVDLCSSLENIAGRTVTNVLTELTAAGIIAPTQAYRTKRGPKLLRITALGRAWRQRRTLLPVPIYDHDLARYRWWTPTLDHTELLLPDEDTPGLHIRPGTHAFDQAPPTSQDPRPSE